MALNLNVLSLILGLNEFSDFCPSLKFSILTQCTSQGLLTLV